MPDKLTDVEALELVKKQFDYSKRSKQRTDFLDKAERLEKLYLGDTTSRYDALKDARQEWRSNLFYPMTLTNIETFVPYIVMNLWGKKPVITFQPRRQNDVIGYKIAEALVDMQFDEMQMFLNYIDWTREGAKLGTSVASLNWHEEWELREVAEKSVVLKLLGIKKTSLKPLKIYDGWKWSHIDMRDCYWDAGRKRIKDMSFFGNREVVNLEFLDMLSKKRPDIYNKQAISEIKKNSEGCASLTELERRNDTFDSPTLNEEMKPVLLWKYVENDRIIWVLNEKHVFRNTRSPYSCKEKYYLDMQCISQPFKFTSLGLAEITEDLNVAANDLMNSRIDNVNFLMQQMSTVIEDFIPYKMDLLPRPGGIVRVRRQDAYQPIVRPPMPIAPYSEQEQFEEAAQNATGIFDIIKGASPQRRETATAFVRLQNAAGNRMFMLTVQIAQQTICEMARLMNEGNYDLIEGKRLVRILGDDPETMEALMEWSKAKNRGSYNNPVTGQWLEMKSVDLERDFDEEIPQSLIDYVPTISIQVDREFEAKKIENMVNMLYGKEEVDNYNLVDTYITALQLKSPRPLMQNRQFYDAMKKMRLAAVVNGMKETGFFGGTPNSNKISVPGTPEVGEKADISMSRKIQRQPAKRTRERPYTQKNV